MFVRFLFCTLQGVFRILVIDTAERFAVGAEGEGVALLDEVVLQDMVGPLAKLHTTFRINTIADRDDHVQIIEWNNALYCSFTFNLNLCFFCTG